MKYYELHKLTEKSKDEMIVCECHRKNIEKTSFITDGFRDYILLKINLPVLG